ncbi:MAG: hypothetical protein HC837_03830 [Chloroflexaceae bacterium]|nr:hypothetical protein [Chloroflexaceae bacterium]
MSTAFEATMAIYVALAVALTVWFGIFLYIWRLEASVKSLRRRLEEQPEGNNTPLPGATLTRNTRHDGSSEPGEPMEARQEC